MYHTPVPRIPKPHSPAVPLATTPNADTPKVQTTFPLILYGRCPRSSPQQPPRTTEAPINHRKDHSCHQHPQIRQEPLHTQKQQHPQDSLNYQTNVAPFEFIGIHRKGGELQEEFQVTEPAVYQLGPKGKHYFKYLRQLRKLLLDNNIQVAHAQQFIDCIYAKLATIGTGIKVVQTFHGYDFDGLKLDKKLINLSFKLSDADLFVSQTQQDYYVEQYHVKTSHKSSTLTTMA